MLLRAALCLQDVPAALNGLLDSLPAKISIQGLPFDAVFTYALYTLNYVIVKVRGNAAAAPHAAATGRLRERGGGAAKGTSRAHVHAEGVCD